nr:YibE/F family protein [Pseudonocardia sp. AL041005-10]
MRRLLVALLVPCVLATLAGVALLWPGATPVPEIPPTQQVHGTVTAVQVADCSPGGGDRRCTGVTVALSDGPRAGRDLVQLVPNEPSTPRFAVGDPVTLSWSGANPDDAGSYQLVDFQRGAPLGWLAAAFALAVVVLGRLRGFAALVSLALSFVILLWFVLPAILSGGSPLAVAVTGACLIMFVVLYLTHGFTARTSCAVLGTLASLALIGVLGYLFTVTSRLTGLDDTTATLIGTLGPGVPIDPRGLVLAGLVIGALGALDDVTVTQASAVWELGAANTELGVRELFAAGMRIGRDHVASAVNTLVLAYAGAALPLMLLFTVAAGGVTQVLTSQDVATEIVRTLVGSIGLVAAVPVTTGLAALVVGRR